MLTRMSEAEWALVVKIFRSCRSRRGEKRRDDRKFLEALHHFTVHNITWRALPAEFGNWNSVWKRFWRLSQAGVFEAFFDTLASLSGSAHLVQMFDSTVVRAHVSAAGAKGGSKANRAICRKRGIAPVIPQKSNAKQKPKFFPKALYKARARIEQAVGKLKRFKRIALRCEKTKTNFLSFVALAAGFILIKSVHTT
jgi:transposase